MKCIYILGFPGETLTQMNETINFARSVDSDWSLFNIATPLLGTPKAQQFIDRGNVPDDIFILSETDFKRRAFDTNEISAAELNKLQYRANLDINFVNNRLFRVGKYEEAIGIFSDILLKYPHHVFAMSAIAYCKKMTEDEGAYREMNSLISEKISSDSRAASMMETYGDLIPDHWAINRKGFHHDRSNVLPLSEYVTDEMSDE